MYTMKTPDGEDVTVLPDPEPIDKFPRFTDGDVTIIVSTSRVYRLHSHTLRQKSEYFRHYLQPASATKLTAIARRSGHTPWRFQLYQQSNFDVDASGRFIPIVRTLS